MLPISVYKSALILKTYKDHMDMDMHLAFILDQESQNRLGWKTSQDRVQPLTYTNKKVLINISM